MKAHPREAIFKIAKFLGPSYVERLESSPEFIEKVLTLTSFEHLSRLNATVNDLAAGRHEDGLKTDASIPDNVKRILINMNKAKSDMEPIRNRLSVGKGKVQH